MNMFLAVAKLSPHRGIDAVVANAGVAGKFPTFNSPAENIRTLEAPPPPNFGTLELNLIGGF